MERHLHDGLFIQEKLGLLELWWYFGAAVIVRIKMYSLSLPREAAQDDGEPVFGEEDQSSFQVLLSSFQLPLYQDSGDQASDMTGTKFTTYQNVSYFGLNLLKTV